MQSAARDEPSFEPEILELVSPEFISPEGSQASRGNDDAARPREEAIAIHFSEMKALRPEAVRATYVFQALQRAGRALRGGGSDFYHLSQATKRIHAFWSHSWHGNKWMKVATLLFLSNSTPAALLGLAASVLTALAVQYNWIRSDSSVNYWCLAVGSAAYALGMLFWRSR